MFSLFPERGIRITATGREGIHTFAETKELLGHQKQPRITSTSHADHIALCREDDLDHAKRRRNIRKCPLVPFLAGCFSLIIACPVLRFSAIPSDILRAVSARFVLFANSCVQLR